MSDPVLTRIAEALERIAPAPAPAPSFTEASAYIWHPDPDRLEPVDTVNRVDLVQLIGIDTASIDYGQSTEFAAHVTLMTNNIPAFENVGDMSKLPAKGFQIFAFPMKIKGGSGGPLRIAALILEK